MKKKVVFDIEIYKDYSLFSFSDLDGTRFVELEMFEGHPLDRAKLKAVLKTYTIISFNGINFDLPITFAAISGASCQRLKDICDSIIANGDPHWKTNQKFDINEFPVDHIDIIEPSPGVAVSLKLYGGRLNAPKLQDLPIEPSASIRPDERNDLRLYCRNDLATTAMLYKAIKNEVDIRADMSEQYGIDLRSKSGAQVAKAVIGHQLKEIGVKVKTQKVKEGTTYRYKMPDFINFASEQLNELKDLIIKSKFVVNDKGSVLIPDELKKVIRFDGAKYKIGIGGLHSQEKKQAIVCGENQIFGEFDYASMYPFIILNQNLYPSHLGKRFLTMYKDIVDRRIAAKKLGDKATSESLKLVINSSFGLFGNKYSFLYSPDLLIQTTITGQLCLLMLIEKVVAAGGKVVSANTDGINIICHKDKFREIQAQLDTSDLDTGMTLEFTPYQATYNESVNSYIAVMPDGTVKSKGNYTKPGLMKNTVNTICIESVIEYLTNKTPVEQTINGCNDVTKFVTVRTVNGGAVWREQYLGKVVRFYHAIDGHTINYKKNGNKVANSDGCAPLMDLPDTLPNDLNKDWYISEAKKMIGLLGVDYA
tara:strand:+ start:6400 stop:8175 length:1776 start_codon:yes stop_codon:yes gene_type:complete